MTWAVLTAANGSHLELQEIGLPTMERYASRHGMDMIVGQPGTEYPASWYKIPLMMEALADHEGVLWVDADAMFVAFDRDIQEEANAPWNWVYHDAGRHPNCGVLAVKQEGMNVLEMIWSMRDSHLDIPWEQSAAHAVFGLDRVGRLNFPDGQAYLDGCWNWTPYNATPYGYSSPIIRHTAGMEFEDRVRLMTEWATEALSLT